MSDWHGWEQGKIGNKSHDAVFATRRLPERLARVSTRCSSLGLRALGIGRLALMAFVSGYLAAAGVARGAEPQAGEQGNSGLAGRVAEVDECARRDVPSTPAGVDDDDEAAVERANCLMKAGKNGLASLLLQRLVAKQPDNARALEMLRRTELSLGLAQDALGPATPPARWSDKLGLGGWVAVAAGRDSNINSATNRESINVPLLNYRSLDLPPLLIQKGSPFAGVHIGLTGSYSLAPTWELALRGAASARYNSAAGYFPHSYFASGVLTKYLGAVSVNVELSSMQHWVNKYSAVERNAIAIGAEFQLTPSVAISAGADTSKNRYQWFSDVRANSDGGYVGVRHEPSGLSLQLGAGSERSSVAIRDLDRNFAGATLTWSQRFEHVGRLTIVAGDGWSDYTEFSRLFNTYRHDRTRGLYASLDYPLSRDWHLTPRLAWERHDSNLPLVAFTRHQWLLELRRDY